jgi:hypothetical protein
VLGGDGEADPVRPVSDTADLQLRLALQRAAGEDRQLAQAGELAIEADPGDRPVGRRPPQRQRRRGGRRLPRAPAQGDALAVRRLIPPTGATV